MFCHPTQEPNRLVLILDLLDLVGIPFHGKLVLDKHAAVGPEEPTKKESKNLHHYGDTNRDKDGPLI